MGDGVGQRLVIVGHDMDGGSDVRHVGPWEAEKDTHEDVRFADFPATCPFHDLAGGGCPGPLQHGRRDDPRL